MRLKDRKKGLVGVLKLKASSTKANRECFQDVAVARAIIPPKLSKVKPVKERRVKINENNNIEYAIVHRIDVVADSDSDGTFLDGVPAVMDPEGGLQDITVIPLPEEQYESACED